MNVMAKLIITAALIVAAFTIGHKMGETAAYVKCAQSVIVGEALVLPELSAPHVIVGEALIISQ